VECADRFAGVAQGHGEAAGSVGDEDELGRLAGVDGPLDREVGELDDIGGWCADDETDDVADPGSDLLVARERGLDDRCRGSGEAVAQALALGELSTRPLRGAIALTNEAPTISRTATRMSRRQGTT
jgi:hypothetical protein